MTAASADRPPVILIADDDRSSRETSAKILRDQGMEVQLVDDGQLALEHVSKGGIDLVLLDVVMPKLGGLECCRLIKANAGETFLPVVLLTVRTDTDNRVEGLRIGADDYVGKPFDERELVARVTSLLRVKRLHDELAEAKLQLEDLATHDELTQLYNYRYLHHRLSDEYKRAQRYGDPLSCIMVDVDHFKQINDRHGHDVGDAVLREIAWRLSGGVREVDVVARYGGEEFLVVLPSTDSEGAMILADRLRILVSATPIVVGSHTTKSPGTATGTATANTPAANEPRESGGVSLTVTISAGVASYPHPLARTKDRLIKLADEALYQAKLQGRDRVCAAKQVAETESAA